ncbi:HNH endonuclease signature motif containing protein [Corynebacterium pacaense]|uniref:HNH endonuclease signature motif containing protein n=1 Tax=Corynebacterium pacaense TaxID=1816684 RepID=UPI00117875CA|nr:HNH endonuclease signature motif containing protein [Corynebacterium pacaense]
MTVQTYFCHQNPNSAQSFVNYEITKSIYHQWQLLLSEDEHDADSLVTELMRVTGQSRNDVNKAIKADRLLKLLPELRVLVEEMFHVGISYLARIMDAISRAHGSILSVLEQRIVDRLTPRVADEAMIQASDLAGLITKWIKELDPTFQGPRPRSERDSEYLEFDTRGDSTYIRGKLASADARRLLDTLTSVGKGRMSLPEALRAFLDRRAPLRVVQYLYTPKDRGRPWIAGVGYLGAVLAADWEERIKRSEDLDEMENVVEPGYRPSRRMRAAVMARDGHCRFPSCSVPADRCQLDHVLAWEKGGPTAMYNLICCCQHHHNMKSDGRYRPELNEGGEVMWIGPMNQPVVTSPLGPFAEVMPTGLWGQTLRQRMAGWCDRRRRG